MERADGSPLSMREIRTLTMILLLSAWTVGSQTVPSGASQPVSPSAEQAASAEPSTPAQMTALAREYELGTGRERDINKALLWYKKAAESNDPAALLALAELYDQGRCVEQDIAQAKALYTKAADAGYPPAMYKMASMLELREPDVSILLYEKAAAAGYGPALTRLGDLDNDPAYYRRATEAGDPAAFAKLAAKLPASEALPLLERGAALGDPAAKRELALRVETSNPQRALAEFRSAAERGDPKAMVKYAEKVESTNPGEARVWYDKAAAGGEPTALTWVAARNLQNEPTKSEQMLRKAVLAGHAPAMEKLAKVTDNKAEAEALLKAAADAGQPDALVQLAKEEPKATPGPDPKLLAAAEAGHPEALAALGRFEEAAGRGHVASMLKVGQFERAAQLGNAEGMYRYGLAQEDLYLGSMWIARAAEAGYAPAMSEVAVRHQAGKGLPQDPAAAQKWWNTAAEHKDPEALYRLGRHQEAAAAGHLGARYAVGQLTAEQAAQQGVPKAYFDLGRQERNAKRAFEFYRKAAEGGYAPAMTAIGDALLNGRGTYRSEIDAVNWYRKAVYAGDQEAMKKLADLGKSL
jgi:TPR repeat protein